MINEVITMIKSYDYILGNGKFINLFDIITGVIICSAISFCLTETLFSFNFKLSFQKVLIFTILFLLLLLLFYYFIKQPRKKGPYRGFSLSVHPPCSDTIISFIFKRLCHLGQQCRRVLHISVHYSNVIALGI